MTRKEIKHKGITCPIYHEHYLREPEAVILTEAPFDAMAAEVLTGNRAAALCGLATRRLYQVLMDTPENMRPHIIVAMDNDDAGRNAADTITKRLTEIGISVSTIDTYGYQDEKDEEGNRIPIKDFNERLVYVRKHSSGDIDG